MENYIDIFFLNNAFCWQDRVGGGVLGAMTEVFGLPMLSVVWSSNLKGPSMPHFSSVVESGKECSAGD